MKAIVNSATCPKCGSGHKSKPFCLYENGWYCFACGYTKAADRGYSIHNRRIDIPDWPDATNNYEQFNLSVKLWLTERGITADDVRNYNIYSKDDCILMIGCKDPLFYQSRNVLTREFDTKGQKSPTLLKGYRSEILVIVEDYISAIRVSHNADVVCLWGTSCSIAYLYEWFKQYDEILVWLDNDVQKQTNSGQDAAKEIINKSKKCIQNYNKKYGYSLNKKIIRNIVSDKDPKDYYDSEIKAIIRSALNGEQ